MTIPEDLEEGLLKNLRVYSHLKRKFALKRAAIADSLKEMHHFEKFEEVYKKTPSQLPRLLTIIGFGKKRPYQFLNVSLNTVAQSKDYLNLFYDFDATMHEHLSKIYNSPEDKVTPYLGNPNKEYKKLIKAFYKYVHYLAD